MKVILQQDVRGQGKKGQMIDAAEGLRPQLSAAAQAGHPATADAINTMNLKEKRRAVPRRRRTAPPPWRPRTSCVTAP